jgi:hypothetical protein
MKNDEMAKQHLDSVFRGGTKPKSRFLTDL